MAPLSLQTTYKLNSGYEIPIVGFGVSYCSSSSSSFRGQIQRCPEQTLTYIVFLDRFIKRELNPTTPPGIS